MNTYSKFCANVFVAKCTEAHEKGDIIEMTTKHGKNHNCVVFNLVNEFGGHFYYSVLREDGYNAKVHAEKKAAKLLEWKRANENKSDEYFKRSEKDRGFLSLGEPIKVGHHSERRHRRIIEQSYNNTKKSIELQKKADSLQQRAEYWEKKADSINLSMPESLEFYSFKLEQAKALHAGIKAGTIERRHAYSLAYAMKDVNELSKKVSYARLLWEELPNVKK